MLSQRGLSGAICKVAFFLDTVFAENGAVLGQMFGPLSAAQCPKAQWLNNT